MHASSPSSIHATIRSLRCTKTNKQLHLAINKKIPALNSLLWKKIIHYTKRSEVVDVGKILLVVIISRIKNVFFFKGLKNILKTRKRPRMIELSGNLLMELNLP